jgi:ribonuclease HI
MVHVYCDGACSPNPGWGGWGALLVSPSHDNYTRELSGSEPATTNNRMELTGAIRALEALKQPCEVLLHTDSQYVHKAFTEDWLTKWAARGWMTSKREPVLNVDLWVELVRLSKVHEITWIWVKGHGTNVLHNRCDELAVQARVSAAASAAAAASA